MQEVKEATPITNEDNQRVSNTLEVNNKLYKPNSTSNSDSGIQKQPTHHKKQRTQDDAANWEATTTQEKTT